MFSEKVTTNRTIERAELIINSILKHLDNDKDCQHCRALLEEAFE
jgi:hypothetical protein